MKIAIYTVLIENYDIWRDPSHVQSGADYFVFTNLDIKPKYHKVIHIEKGDNPILTARTWKIYSGYKMLSRMSYDLIAYSDANIVQTADFSNLVKMQVCDLMLLKHPIRDCIYNEFHACNDARKDDVGIMFDQVQRYADIGYPKHNGLAATGVIFRRSNDKVLEFCRAWLTEVENGSIRDQLSYNYVAWKLDYKFDFMDWQFIYDYFDYYNKHKR